MTKPYAKLIKAELDWMNDAQEVWGNLLIDPYMIALNRENPGLKRLFTESGLNRKKADHWKLLLARIAAVTYRPKTAGPGRPIEWTPKDNHDLLKAALLIRIDDPKSVEKISEDLVDRHKRCKDLTPEYIREKIQRLLAEARLLLAPKIFPITNHREYKLGAKGQLMRDVVWAFSKAGKAELKRRINAKRQQL